MAPADAVCMHTSLCCGSLRLLTAFTTALFSREILQAATPPSCSANICIIVVSLSTTTTR